MSPCKWLINAGGVCAALTLSVMISATPLDELLAHVKRDNAAESAEHTQRERTFLAHKTQQQQQLDDTQTALSAAEALHAQLTQQFSDNQAHIDQLNKALTSQAGSLNEVFAVARNVGAEFSNHLHQSMISAQFPHRSADLAPFSNNRVLPNIEELKNLWFLMQQEMTESGKVVQFPTHIMAAEGSTMAATVTRIGGFTAVNGADFLEYSPDSQRFITPMHQPNSQARANAQSFAAAVDATGIYTVSIDPSQGEVVRLLSKHPSLLERIQQGGAVGYAILLLGLIGGTLTLWRLLYLLKVQRQITHQKHNISTLNLNNPLGRILSVHDRAKHEDPQALEIKLEDAILNEVPNLGSGINTLKLLAAIAPLMGLLGTVVGMIATFQAITLFGTSDPKLMAGGISQALVTTVLGLVVAIPLLLGHSLVQARSQLLILLLSQQSAGLMVQNIEADHGAH